MIQEEFFNYVFTSAGIARLMFEKPSSLQWLTLLSQACEEKMFPKGHIILNIGQTPEHIYFLKKGAIIGYYLNADGTQITLHLWSETSIVTDIDGYMNQTPSILRAEVCNDSELMAIHRSAIDRIVIQYPEALLFLMAIQGHFLRYHRERDMDSQTLTAKERFRKLMVTSEKLQTIFTKKSIALLIGISPSHLYDMMNEE